MLVDNTHNPNNFKHMDYMGIIQHFTGTRCDTMKCKKARETELSDLKKRLMEHGYHGIAIQLINQRLKELQQI